MGFVRMFWDCVKLLLNSEIKYFKVKLRLTEVF